MKSIVIYPFYDLEDKDKYIYKVGDKFPHDNRKITKKRLEELSSNKNKIGKPLIEIAEEPKEKNEKKSGK